MIETADPAGCWFRQGLLRLSWARNAAEVALAAQAREDLEAAKRGRFQAGELGLDVYDMRGRLDAAGLRYLD